MQVNRICHSYCLLKLQQLRKIVMFVKNSQLVTGTIQWAHLSYITMYAANPTVANCCMQRLASFPGPAQLSVTCSTEKQDRAWYLFSRGGVWVRGYRIAETFKGENIREFRGFVTICESFLCEIWARGILWCCRSKQSANVFSVKIVFFTNLRKFSPLKFFRYTVCKG